jgi:hypothetical protein
VDKQLIEELPQKALKMCQDLVSKFEDDFLGHWKLFTR